MFLTSKSKEKTEVTLTQAFKPVDLIFGSGSSIVCVSLFECAVVCGVRLQALC